MLPGHADLLTDAIDELSRELPRAGRRAWIEEIALRYEESRRRAEKGGAVRVAGAWYTPTAAVERVLGEAMPRRIPPGFSACDPSCGTGNFLAAVAELLRLERWTGSRIARSVHGMDVDPIAVAIARARMQARFGGGTRAWRAAIRCGDALGQSAWDGRRFSLVVGNPPFLGQLGDGSRRTRAEREAIRGRFAGRVARYADAASAFLMLGAELAPAGTVALIQPLSVLSAADVQPVRTACETSHSLRSLVVLDERTFGASVRTCVPVLAARTASVRLMRVAVVRADGERLGIARSRCVGGAWVATLALARGVPDPAACAAAGTLGDWMTATSDFRDQYYGLRGHVREHDGAARSLRLVTVGAIGAARLDWGTRPTRVHGRTFTEPSVRPDDLAADPRMAGWLALRRGAKVLVATQTRAIEAWVDGAGSALPSVPVITVRPRRKADLWRVGAAILAPSTAAEAWWRHAGAAMSSRAIRVSPSQLLALPAPGVTAAWARGATALRAWQRTGSPEAGLRFAEAMSDAYGVPSGRRRAALHAWWLEAVGARTSQANVRPAPMFC